MEIKISDGLLYKEAVSEIKKQWLIKEYRPGESIVAFSRRIKADRKTIRTLLGEVGIYYDFQYIDSKCMFCNTTEKIHLHHLHGRKNSNVTIPICARCHEMFHLMNRQYSSKLKKSTHWKGENNEVKEPAMEAEIRAQEAQN